MAEEKRVPPFIVKHYRTKEDKYGVEVGVAWRAGETGIAIQLREGLAIVGGLGRVVIWPNTPREDTSRSQEA